MNCNSGFFRLQIRKHKQDLGSYLTNFPYRFNNYKSAFQKVSKSGQRSKSNCITEAVIQSCSEKGLRPATLSKKVSGSGVFM